MRFLWNQTEDANVFTNDKITIYYNVYFHIFRSCFHYNVY